MNLLCICRERKPLSLPADRRLKQLSEENPGLKRLLADLSLDKEMQQDVMGTWVGASTSRLLRSPPCSDEPDREFVAGSSPLIPSCAPISPLEPST